LIWPSSLSREHGTARSPRLALTDAETARLAAETHGMRDAKLDLPSPRFSPSRLHRQKPKHRWGS
jgi:hypothetical protein